MCGLVQVAIGATRFSLPLTLYPQASIMDSEISHPAEAQKAPEHLLKQTSAHRPPSHEEKGGKGN
jgi:hypothetical protein